MITLTPFAGGREKHVRSHNFDRGGRGLIISAPGKFVSSSLNHEVAKAERMTDENFTPLAAI